MPSSPPATTARARNAGSARKAAIMRRSSTFVEANTAIAIPSSVSGAPIAVVCLIGVPPCPRACRPAPNG